eukprot:m.871619 g.871619  ORF g.871619 m.871619 type:complete len:912 (+) comp59764_c0_seq3:839-3574(+)
MASLFARLLSKKKKDLSHVFRHITRGLDPLTEWKVLGDLGEGAFGMVHKVENLQTKEFAAAKVIPVEYEEELEDFVIEVDILTECTHASIIKLYHAYYYNNKLWVIMELCAGGALDDILLDLEVGLTEPQIQAVTYHVLTALVHLQSKRVIHRDMKAGNILLTANGRIKIIDFGVSALLKKEGQRRDTFIGTPFWMAPEVVLCENSKDVQYDFRADIWSLGITLIELAETSPPYHDMHPMRVLFKIPKAPPPTLMEGSKWSSEFKDFLAKCLTKDFNQRPYASELLEHPFVKGKDSLKPIRELLKLAEADVEEVLEDLPEDQPVASDSVASETPPVSVPSTPSSTPSKAPQSPAALTPAAKMATLPPLLSLPDAPVSQGMRRTTLSNTELAPKPTYLLNQHKQSAGQAPASPKIPEGAAALDLIQSELSALALPSLPTGLATDDMKKFKTLTRIRKFVNEEGETVTVKTQKIVQTSAESGKVHTMKRGANPSSEQDWHAQDQRKLALLRKQQERDMKRMQREELKECSELIVRLKLERDQNEEREAKELLELEKEHEKQMGIQQKFMKMELEKLQRLQQATVATLIKAIKTRQQKEIKLLKSTCADEAKALKAALASASKDEKKKQLDELEARHAQSEHTLVVQHEDSLTSEVRSLLADLKRQQLKREEQLLLAEQELIAKRQTDVQDLGDHQLQERQLMLKHQLKATFLMQKHQMHWRHEKEADQLRKYHSKKVADSDRLFDEQRKLLPKRFRVESEKRRKEFKRAILSSENKKTQLLEFDVQEQRKAKAESTKFEEYCRATQEALQQQTTQELEELKQMQSSKKQALVVSETAKVSELEERHAKDAADLRQTRVAERAAIDASFASQLEALRNSYSEVSEASVDVSAVLRASGDLSRAESSDAPDASEG